MLIRFRCFAIAGIRPALATARALAISNLYVDNMDFSDAAMGNTKTSGCLPSLRPSLLIDTICPLFLDLWPKDLHVRHMSASVQNSHEAYRLEVDRGQLIVRAFGRWNLHTVKTIDKALKADLSALGYGHIDGGYSERDDYDQVGVLL